MSPEPGRLPIRAYALRERYRGAMMAHPSGIPPEGSWAAGYRAGVEVALAAALEALSHSGHGAPFDEASWSHGRARKVALELSDMGRNILAQGPPPPEPVAE